MAASSATLPSMKTALNVRIGAKRDAGTNAVDFLVEVAIGCFLFWISPKIELPGQREVIPKRQRLINHDRLT
tara:strand:- start:1522 stop:1737 length:216 start_codon:yes stop_codon:yes gene_type:complete